MTQHHSDTESPQTEKNTHGLWHSAGTAGIVWWKCLGGLFWGMSGEFSGRGGICPGKLSRVGNVWWTSWVRYVQITMQYYKSQCVAVITSASLVNTQTDIQTGGQLFIVLTISSASWAKSYLLKLFENVSGGQWLWLAVCNCCCCCYYYCKAMLTWCW